MHRLSKLSIVIVNYNTRKNVLACLDSIFKYKSNQKFEVWVVDNGSTDGSADIIKKKFPQVKLVENRQNYLYTKANNQALARIRSKYFLILNSDVLLSRNTLSYMIDFMELHPECGLSSLRHSDTKGKTQLTTHHSHTPVTQILLLPPLYRLFKWMPTLKQFYYTGWDRKDIHQVDVIPGSFMFGRTSLLKKIGYLDDKMSLFYSDSDYCERVRKAGYSIYHVGTTQVTHHTSSTLSRFSRTHIEHESYRDMVVYYRKHFGTIWSYLIYLSTIIAIVSDLIFILKYAKFTLRRLYLVWESWFDWKRFVFAFPEFKQLETRFTKNYRSLETHYKKYTEEISFDYMAVSLETATFLLTICQIKKPNAILDLGSGFSTFMFNLYKKEAAHSVEVWSIDDSRKWLNKTRLWLSKKNISSPNLLSWKEFQKLKPVPFDIIFHDLGDMQLRLHTLPQILTLLSPAGLAILDDLQFPFYEPEAKNIIKMNNYKLYSIRKYTKDRFGRYASIVHI